MQKPDSSAPLTLAASTLSLAILTLLLGFPISAQAQIECPATSSAIAPAQAEAACKATNDAIPAVIDSLTADPKEAQRQLDEVRKTLDKDVGQPCMKLQEQALQGAQGALVGLGLLPKEDWHTIEADRTLAAKNYCACKQVQCQGANNIDDLLRRVCVRLGQSNCNDLGAVRVPAAPALPPWRKAIGGTLIAAGSLAVVLGTVHMGIPIFYSSGGCSEHGLDHPCSADRFPAGGSLVGVGLGAIAGGILSLTIKQHGSRENH